MIVRREPLMDDVSSVFLGLRAKRLHSFPIIACLYTNDGPPPFCSPMPRQPAPAIGMPFDANFASLLDHAVSSNTAIHDGAVMLGRRRNTERYCITGWSYRLFPPAGPYTAEPNRGSAYNSCLAMSAVKTVDCLFLVSSEGVLRFHQGRVATAQSDYLSHD
jgi:hypothetical protein